MDGWEALAALAEERMEAVAKAMDSIMEAVMGDGGNGIGMRCCSGDVGMVTGWNAQVTGCLEDAALAMERSWNAISVNEMSLERAGRFARAAGALRLKADLFDVFFTEHQDLLLEWFEDGWAARSLLAGVERFVLGHSYLLERIGGDVTGGCAVIRAFEGSAARFRRYFTGVRERDVEALFRQGTALPGQPRWLGKRCEAVVFGQLLCMSCAQMNMSFRFAGMDGSMKPLNYQKDVPRMDGRFYEIHRLVERQKELMELEDCRH